jgi:hypothetical protein
MSRRVGLRLVPMRAVDEADEAPRVSLEGGEPNDHPADGDAQPPALGATPAATPSR